MLVNTKEKLHQKDDKLDSCVPIVVDYLKELKADDICHIENTSSRSLICDNMVIASGKSTKHVSSIADNLVSYLKKKKIKVFSIEGLMTSNWILIDIGDVMVHVFHPESRKIYDLESMWS
ncbi:ribosome silencing factor [Candidatus Liberibacter brunswickensis]|uniref:ribosome silencing factor n=1 Tax=Candidatus Liberibacter brunswickensis TaxID=1968796 RepID=UPI002FE37B54